MRRAVERFVDREAAPHERSHVVAHLRRCRGCRYGASFLVELRQALRSRRRHDPVMLAAVRLRRWAARIGELEQWPTST